MIYNKHNHNDKNTNNNNNITDNVSISIIFIIVNVEWGEEGFNEGAMCASRVVKEMFALLDLCVSSLRRGHFNLLCIAPSLPDDPRRESLVVARPC